MKKSAFVVGIIGMALVTGFFLAGCKSAPPVAPQAEIPPDMIPGPGESLVIVQRVKRAAGSMISMRVWIDGEIAAGGIKNGIISFIKVSDGEHTIQAGSTVVDRGNRITFTANSEEIVFRATPAFGLIAARFNLTETGRKAVTQR